MANFKAGIHIINPCLNFFMMAPCDKTTGNVTLKQYFF